MYATICCSSTSPCKCRSTVWLLAAVPCRRRVHSLEVSLAEQPNMAAKSYDADRYHVYTSLQIFGTITVTSRECERSGSVLKRLDAYLPASMAQEKMSDLTVIHINYNGDIDKSHRYFCTKEETCTGIP